MTKKLTRRETPEFYKARKALDPESAQGVSRVMERIESGEKMGYPIISMPGWFCVQVFAVCSFIWKNTIRLVFRVTADSVDYVDIGDHERSVRYGCEGVFREKHSQKAGKRKR